MNDDNENVLIIAYNLFCTILIPAVIVLTGIWSLESESDFTHGRTGGLPMGALTVFVPEVILGLKWKMKGRLQFHAVLRGVSSFLRWHIISLLWLQMHQLHIMERCALCCLD